MRKCTLTHQLLRAARLLILPALYFFLRLIAGYPAVVETVYSRKIYPVIRDTVSSITGSVSFSICELIIVIVVLAVFLLLLIRIFNVIVFRKGSFVKLVSTLITLLLTSAYIILLFYLMWGFNYYRLPIGQKLDLPEREYTASDLERVCFELSKNANELRSLTATDENGVFAGSIDDTISSVVDAYNKFGASHPSFKANMTPAKPITFSELLSACGISGIYIFLTEEPNINVNEPFLYIPFTAAHETAHYTGYAHEQDANFLAFLVCKDSGNAELAYSAYMYALVHCGNELARTDMSAYRRLYASYSDGMKSDFDDYRQQIEKNIDSELSDAFESMNDSYLKFNNSESGIDSYTEDTQLIVRYYDSMGFFG